MNNEKKTPAAVIKAGHRKHQTKNTAVGVDVKSEAGSKFYVIIPETLDLEGIIDAVPPDFSYKLDKFYYIINLMYQIPAQDKKCLLRKEFVPLYSPLVKKMVHNYTDYMDYLLEQQILETNGKYSPGRRSTGYKLTAGFRTAKTIMKEVTDPTLLKKLREAMVVQKDVAKYHYLYRYFEGITIKSEAYEYIAAKERKRSKKIAQEKLKLERLSSGTFWFFVDETGKRLHTPISSLSSEMRKFITYQDKPLASVDIKCSQPYFSIGVILDYYGVPEEERQNLDVFLTSIISPSHSTPPIPPISSSPPMFPILSTLPDDVVKYIAEILYGDLYDYLQTEVKNQLGLKFKSRREFKSKVIFPVLYGRAYTIINGRAYTVIKGYTRESKYIPCFHNVFPNVYKILVDNKGSGDNYKKLPIKLQQIESATVLDVLCKRIYEKYPDLPMLTIHDSVITLQGEEKCVEQVIKEAFTERFGYAPQVKVEMW